MALTPSTMLPLGTRCPSFSLPDTDGQLRGPDDYPDAPALLVVFMCNHCPYVIHAREALAALGRECEARGVAMLGISSNDPEAYPDDAPDAMAREKAERGYRFPYLFDADQSVARAFQAACTPEAYLFDGERKLVYRGQLDSTRPNQGTRATCGDLRAAIDAVLDGRPVDTNQRPSVGCNIKWKPGNAPSYA